MENFKEYSFYLDPEEDEVFFSCMNETEKNNESQIIHLYNTGSENFNTDNSKFIDSKQTNEETKMSVVNGDEFNSLHSNNSSIELDHNYSVHIKQKIDKSILATPKSMVNADKDGGFLKVLSEIALVKAEAENNSEVEENKKYISKENKYCTTPEIIITEATPEKADSHAQIQSRRFRIINNSPNKSNIINNDHKIKSKSFTESSKKKDGTQYLNKNKDNNCSNEKNKENILGGIKKTRGNSWPDSNLCNKSENFISFTDVGCCTEINNAGPFNNKSIKQSNLNEQGPANDKLFSKANATFILDLDNNLNEKEKHICLNVNRNEKCTPSNTIIFDEKKEKHIVASKEHSNSYKIINTDNSLIETKDKKQIEEELQENLNNIKALKINGHQHSVVNASGQINKVEFLESCRFSKEAKKIVEALKKSTLDDSLNYTVPEIDVENFDNSFILSKPMSNLDESIIQLDVSLESKGGFSSGQFRNKNQSSQPISIIGNQLANSAKKIQPHTHSQPENFEKKLPMQEKTPAPAPAKMSRIPVSGVKVTKFALNKCDTQSAGTRTSPFRTPSRQFNKPSNLKNIESPINAYIHKQPTFLVTNVKPITKKDGMNKIIKEQFKEPIKKYSGNALQKQPGLPNIEYRSGTPYKLEKHTESRLPRLASSVQKLIGSKSPTVLQHKGRFYLKNPNKKISKDSTLVADLNEVSVVVSQVAQRSNTIK